MDVFQAILLGIIQGITEPIPISSSGHLILAPWLLQWPEHTLTFDVALHAGTALAIVVYFWRDWTALAGALVSSLLERDLASDRRRRLVWYIALASVPGAVAGLAFEETIENSLRAPWLVALLLMGMGLVMLAADRTSRRHRSLHQLGLLDALIIGIAQAFALAPGVSRSGITITAALFLQVNRADAARFSFLLSGPIVVGAAIYKMAGVVRDGLPADERLPFAAGVLAAAVVGFAAIRFLLSYLQKRSLALFVFYRLALGALALGVFLSRGVG